MRVALLLGALLSLCFAATIKLDFEDIPDFQSIGEFYNGGTSGDGTVGTENFGVSFSADAVTISEGNSNVANFPSGIRGFFFMTDAGSVMNVPLGFDSMDFWYVAAARAGSVSFYSGINKGGNLLKTVTLVITPTIGQGASYDNWQKISVLDLNGAQSMDFSGSVGWLAFDDIELDPQPACSEEKGTQVTIGSTNYCSCFSGYTGDSCGDEVQDHAPVAVSDANVAFPIALNFVHQTNSPQLIVTVPSTKHKYNKDNADVGYSTTTLIAFGGAERKCDYLVHSGWEVTADGSDDVYTGTFTWSDLSDCGLTSTPDGDYTKFSNTIKFTRNFVIGNGRFEIVREVSQEDEFSVSFPNRISTHSEVIVADNTVNAFAAISSVNYDPVSNGGEWIVKLKTIVAFPYKLKLLDDYTAPIASRGFAMSSTVTESQCSTSASDKDQDCSQVYTFTFSECQFISYTSWALNFQPVCRAAIAGNDKTPDLGSECPSPNDEPALPFVVTTSLTTSDACSVDKTYDIGTVVLASFTSNSFDTATTLFGTSETAYFTIDFTLPPAAISVKSVDTVCAYPVPVADPGEEPVYPASCPTANSLTSAQWTDETANLPGGSTAELAFSANGGDLKTASGVTDTNHFIVHADIELTYSGGLSKRATLIKQYAGDVKLVIHDDSNSLAAPKHSSSSALVAGFGIVFACVLLL